MSARVIVVGGGPAGLTAAAGLAPHADVIVLERESATGGIPRHSDHPGYGMRDLRRFLTGPAYARALTQRAERAGAQLRTNAMVTGWTAAGELEVTSPAGREVLTADAIVLATGARERPRAARLVPGDRPAGVYTTGQLQNLVHLHHRSPGTRAVVVGGQLVSWSAVVTLREAGCRTVALTTEFDRPESYAAFTLAGRIALRVPVATRTRVVRVIGHGRVSGVEVEELDTGARREIPCDTVVFTGDWIPDNELARAVGLDLDPATRGPLVDTASRTSRAGVFAAGNLLHPVDTADIAALGGGHAAEQVRAWLAGARPAADVVRLIAEAPFRWVAPGLLRAGDTRPPRVVLWPDRSVRYPRVTVRQSGRVLARATVPWPASPGRAFHLPWRLLRDVDPTGGDVRLGVDE